MNKESIERVNTSLEIDEQINLHKKGWKAQAVGLAFMYILVLLAAVGLFGDGLLSKNKLTEQNITIESQRFYRYEARMELKIDVPDTDSDRTVISLPSHYLKDFEIESIVPEPESNSISNDKVNYVFKGSGNLNVTFYLVPQKVGKLEGTLGVNEHAFLLNHFIFP
jgi:hypothetical protein